MKKWKFENPYGYGLCGADDAVDEEILRNSELQTVLCQ